MNLLYNTQMDSAALEFKIEALENDICVLRSKLENQLWSDPSQVRLVNFYCQQLNMLCAFRQDWIRILEKKFFIGPKSNTFAPFEASHDEETVIIGSPTSIPTSDQKTLFIQEESPKSRQYEQNASFYLALFFKDCGFQSITLNKVLRKDDNLNAFQLAKLDLEQSKLNPRQFEQIEIDFYGIAKPGTSQVLFKFHENDIKFDCEKQYRIIFEITMSSEIEKKLYQLERILAVIFRSIGSNGECILDLVLACGLVTLSNMQRDVLEKLMRGNYPYCQQMHSARKFFALSVGTDTLVTTETVESESETNCSSSAIENTTIDAISTISSNCPIVVNEKANDILSSTESRKEFMTLTFPDGKEFLINDRKQIVAS